MSQQQDASDAIEKAYQYALKLASHTDKSVREHALKMLESLGYANKCLERALEELKDAEPKP